MSHTRINILSTSYNAQNSLLDNSETFSSYRHHCIYAKVGINYFMASVERSYCWLNDRF